MATLPPWDDSMSDGCSVPWFLRWIFPMETPEQREKCVQHDKEHYYGGTRQQFLDSAEKLYQGLLATKMEPWVAKAYRKLILKYGVPEYHRLTTRLIGRPQAWAYGGGVFAYTGES